VLLDRLGGDPVGEGADLELVVAEEVGVVGGGEVGGELVEFGVDGLVDGSGEIVDLGSLLRRQGCGWHGGLRFRHWVFLGDHRFPSCVQRFRQLSRCSPLDLADEFTTLIRKQSTGTLVDWLSRAEVGACPEVRHFAEGIRRDESAVNAAVTMRWSNGPVEGHVNRLKTIKRQMYGRAGFTLLKARVVSVE
jgi:hypothetical protein